MEEERELLEDVSSMSIADENVPLVNQLRDSVRLLYNQTPTSAAPFVVAFNNDRWTNDLVAQMFREIFQYLWQIKKTEYVLDLPVVGPDDEIVEAKGPQKRKRG